MPRNWEQRRIKMGAKLIEQGVRTAGNPSIGNMALLAYRGVKGLRALVNSEEHEVDTSLNASLTASTPVVQLLNGVAQGNAKNNRAGNSILLKKMYKQETIYLTSGTTALVRELILFDKQQISDTAPSWTDVLESTGTNALFNSNIQGRFQILSDKQFALTTNNPIKIIRSSKVFKKKHSFFNGSSDTDIQKMGLFRMIVAESTNVSVVGKIRVFYHDN